MDTELKANAAELTLSRSVASLQTFADWLDRRVEDLALPAKTAYAMRLCVEEAVMNSFYHATSDEMGEHPIVVWAGVMDGAPAAWIEDDGPPFDPVSAALPEKPGALASAAIGGAGLRLMRHYARQMRYSRVDARNRLVLTF